MRYKAVEELQPIEDYIIINHRTYMVVNISLFQDMVELAVYDKIARKHDTFWFPYNVILKIDARKDYC
jgi:hypothetical protein